MDSILPLAALVIGYYYFTGTPSLESLKDKPSFTLYHWSQCGHCKEMMPQFNALGRSVNGIRIRKVETADNKELQVTSFPTLIYRQGAFSEEYTGARLEDVMRTYLMTKNHYTTEEVPVTYRDPAVEEVQEDIEEEVIGGAAGLFPKWTKKVIEKRNL